MKMYHVAIELTDRGHTKVGGVISVMERCKFVFHEKVERSLEPGILKKEIIDLESRTKDPKFLDPLKSKYSKPTLEKRIHHFIYNHVDLSFETEEEHVDVENLRAIIYLRVYPEMKKPPIVCVYEETF